MIKAFLIMDIHLVQESFSKIKILNFILSGKAENEWTQKATIRVCESTES